MSCSATRDVLVRHSWVVFAMMLLSSKVSDTANRVIFWSVNIGVIGFAVGLILESAEVKRVFAPILGLGLLYAIWTYLTAPDA